MKHILVAAFFVLVLGCSPKSPDPGLVPVIPPVAIGAGTGPAILEAQVEGVGKALIVGRSIIIKLPAGYAKSSVRINYTVTKGVSKITPASGSEIPIRGFPFRPICIEEDSHGNCLLFYQLVIEAQSPLTVSIEPDSMNVVANQFYQPFKLTFALGNLKTDVPVARQFRVRFVNKATQYVYTTESCMVYDLAGQPIFVNQLNQPPMPNEGKLVMHGSVPLAMSAGEYLVTIQTATCYTPIPNGGCSSYGYESVELPTPFVVKASAPVVGWVDPVVSDNHTIVLKGRNLTTKKGALTVQLTNDFAPVLVAQPTVLNDTLAQLTLPATQPTGQYQLEVLVEGGKTNRSLFAIPPQKTSPSFAYVSSLGSFAATQNWFPKLPTFKRGAALEVRYTFMAGDRSYGASMTRTVKQVRLISTANPNLSYPLIEGGSFRPFALATDFYMWKWTLPNNVPAGTYALVFDDFDGMVSLPYYQAIRIE